jgi:hypothetical protein
VSPALASFQQLTDEIEMLKHDKPLGSFALHPQLEKFAKIVDYKITKEGNNA